jgi:N-acetyl-anhydromuramyl-L-alanine amidase AmpD
MKKLNLSACFLVLSFITQAQFQSAFDAAYRAHPVVPKPLLEALAYSSSHLQNLQPEEAFDPHHGPGRYGLFALVEDGKGYFKNNLTAVCEAGGVTAAAFKKDPAIQVMAMAAWLEKQCNTFQVRSLADMAGVIDAVSEIPDAGTVNAFAKASARYSVYQILVNGIATNRLTTSAVTIPPTAWFTPETYRLMTAPGIVIKGDEVTDGTTQFKGGNAVMNAAAATDYPPALWVTSPNFSSRSLAISAVTIHTTQGSYAGSISWFQNTASGVSAHYLLRSSDGQVTQMVREVNKAWHVGSENSYTIGLEHEGFVNDASWYTTAMYTASANLVKDICTDNGINPTTCYNGPASAGTNLLAASIKIKGHQHYPNQTHTDPGINWNWGSYYNLINPVTCNASATLNTSYINTAFANLNWTAVTGAANYTVEWKTTAATTWNSGTTSNNYYTIAGLAASTSYNWRIKTNCSGGSAYSVTKTFTTQASCWDPHEANNVYTAPKLITSLTGYTYGKICGSGDIDFYKITTTATQNIIFKLATLPKNYNIETYTGSGAYLAGGYATGTADETVTLFNKPAGSYLFRVYGATTTDNDAMNDYRLQITLAAPTAARFGAMQEEAAVAEKLSVNPNPASGMAMLVYNAAEAGNGQIVVTDFYGRPVYNANRYMQQGMQQLRLDAARWDKGIYMVSVVLNGLRTTTRMMVTR